MAENRTKGMIVGTAILLAGYVAWGVTVYMQAATAAMSMFMLALPAVAGFVASWLGPRGALAPTVLLAVPAGVFAGVLNFTLQMVGADVGFYSGLSGSLRVAAYNMLSAGLFCAIGSLLGVIARQVRGTA